MSRAVHRCLAIVAHPDDIEFLMAGTLLHLKAKGVVTHYMTLASGNCGSVSMSAAQTRKVRAAESRRAAGLLGAVYHPSLVDDLEILYEIRTLRRLAAVIRQVSPTIVLTHSTLDYMEDHMNTSRLAVTAAFSRGMSNFKTVPSAKAIQGDVVLYHAMPHGLTDGMGVPQTADLFVNVASVLSRKREALACHASQKEWLDVSQGMDSYLLALEDSARQVGRMSRKFRHAEGFRKHSHLGFCGEHADPLRDILGDLCLARSRSKILRN